MIDLSDLRQRPDVYRAACAKKRMRFDLDGFLELDSRYRTLKSSLDQLRAEQNACNKVIPTLSGQEKTQKLAAMKELSQRLKDEAQELREVEERWNEQQLLIPSIPLDSVPDGDDDTQNVPMHTWGEKREFSFPLKDHVELGTSLGIIDIERGVKVGGARNYFLKGDGARLQHAVLSFAMDLLHKRGYTLMDPPHLVKYAAMMGTGYFPGDEDAAYRLDERDPGTYLIGTSEVPVCSYHLDEILEESDLPKRMAGYSPCYRREAGSYGKDTHGLYRVHQFYKVEQVIICRADPKESAERHQELLRNAEELLQLLELPYRVVAVCSGDMGRGQVYKNDIECWMPSRGMFGETHSCSTFHDFQARRLMLRYRAGGRNIYCHTLNNTLVASPRILIPILENNQQEDGSIRIPEVLRPYMGGQEFITGNRS
jgi:seryl-tRNA synthetase